MIRSFEAASYAPLRTMGPATEEGEGSGGEGGGVGSTVFYGGRSDSERRRYERRWTALMACKLGGRSRNRLTSMARCDESSSRLRSCRATTLAMRGAGS